MKKEKTNVNVETLINLNKDYPRGSRVITTMFNKEIDYDVILTDDILDDEQFVVAAGPFVTDLNPGDKVRIDLEKLSVTLQDENGERYTKLKVEPIMIGETICGLISESIIKTIIK